MQQQLKQHQQLQQQIEQLESFAKRFMSPDAISRYGNLKAVHTEKAIQSLVVITEMVREGQIREPISDEAYKNMLLHMTPQRENTVKVTRK